MTAAAPARLVRRGVTNAHLRDRFMVGASVIELAQTYGLPDVRDYGTIWPCGRPCHEAHCKRVRWEIEARIRVAMGGVDVRRPRVDLSALDAYNEGKP
jgi:hypothetical protein